MVPPPSEAAKDTYDFRKDDRSRREGGRGREPGYRACTVLKDEELHAAADVQLDPVM